jgi:hypothetical protein
MLVRVKTRGPRCERHQIESCGRCRPPLIEQLNPTVEPQPIHVEREPPPFDVIPKSFLTKAVIEKAPTAQKAETASLPRAMRYLEDALKSGPLPASQVLREALIDGAYPEKTLRRAKQLLGIQSVKTGTRGSPVQQWLWKLPSAPHAEPSKAANLG